MSVSTRLFRSNRTQAVRLPREVAFPEDVEVEISIEGNARIITPVGGGWDRFFDSVQDAGLDVPERDQPQAQDRDWS